MRRKERGFTLLELAVVTIIVGILFTFALTRLLEIMVDAERVSQLQVEAVIKSALGLELSRLAVEGGLESIGALEGVNPMDLLHETPHNYHGVSETPDLSALPGGVWLFDSSRRILIYTVKNSEYFHTDLKGRPRAEYRLALHYDDNNRNGHFDYRIDRLAGVWLASIGQYRWFSGKE